MFSWEYKCISNPRMDIRNYMEEIRSGKYRVCLKMLLSGCRYIRYGAERVEILDMIQKEFAERRGLLAKLQDYEPVEFWERE